MFIKKESYKHFKKKQKLTEKILSEKMEISTAKLYRIASSRIQPSEKELEILCSCLKCEPEDLKNKSINIGAEYKYRMNTRKHIEKAQKKLLRAKMLSAIHKQLDIEYIEDMEAIRTEIYFQRKSNRGKAKIC